MKHRYTTVMAVLMALALVLPVVGQAGDDDDDAPLLATVNFGAGLNTTGPANHILIPDKVSIQRGGIVNFIVSGFHQIAVYEPGVEPGDIGIDLLNGPLINDPNGRLYLGLDPRGDDDPDFEDPNFNHNRNRVEAVLFETPGCHLIICTVRGHFVDDNMFGFVCVKEDDDKDDD